MPTQAAIVLDTVQSFLTLASLLFTALPMSYCRFDEDDDDDDDVMSPMTSVKSTAYRKHFNRSVCVFLYYISVICFILLIHEIKRHVGKYLFFIF